MTQTEFNALWPVDSMPACPVGMILLKEWTETLPPVSNIKRLVFLALEDGITSTEPAWVAIERHLSFCKDCNMM